MRQIGAVLGIVTVAFLSGIAGASCDDDCTSTFHTCQNLCRQVHSGKPGSPEASQCINHCFHGVAGCQKRCESKAKEKTSETIQECPRGTLLVADTGGLGDTAGASCIEKGLTCILTGTPCCAPYDCKGKFPNTYCQ